MRDERAAYRKLDVWHASMDLAIACYLRNLVSRTGQMLSALHHSLVRLHKSESRVPSPEPRHRG